MKNFLFIITLFCIGHFFMFVNPAHAEFNSGNDLMVHLQDYIDNESSFNSGYATGYIIGVVDTAIHGELLGEPHNVSQDKIIQVVINYMKKHPEELNASADYCIIMALREAWPKK